LAELCIQKAHYAAAELAKIPGYSLAYSAPFFNEFTLRTPVPAAEVNRFLLTRDIIGGYDLGSDAPQLQDCLVLAFTEMTTRRHIDDLVESLRYLQPEQALSEAVAQPGVTAGGGE
jgi:glycine dehydrogenase subunit 1